MPVSSGPRALSNNAQQRCQSRDAFRLAEDAIACTEEAKGRERRGCSPAAGLARPESETDSSAQGDPGLGPLGRTRHWLLPGPQFQTSHAAALC